MCDITQLLKQIAAGNRSANGPLFEAVYDALKALARGELNKEWHGKTLQPTALVHEAYLRLVSSPSTMKFEDRRHFFGAAAEAMRRILVDRARGRLAMKRGGAANQVNIAPDEFAVKYTDQDLVDTDDLLDSLSRVDASTAELVRLHVFGGFTFEEISTIQGISRATAYREWSFARAWLRDAVYKKKS